MGKHEKPDGPKDQPFKPSEKPNPDGHVKPGGAHADPKGGKR